MPTYQLNTSGSVVLNAQGAGTVRLQNNKPFQKWKIDRLAVTTTTNTNEPQVKVYLDSVSEGNLLDGTYTGSNDSTDINTSLLTGQSLVVVWSGGDSGAVATASIYGTMEDPR
jgi:hypothetical protein